MLRFMNGTGVERVDDWLNLVAKQAASLRFGTIQIVVHDSKIVQVERTEKFRFENQRPAEHPISKRDEAHQVSGG